MTGNSTCLKETRMASINGFVRLGSRQVRQNEKDQKSQGPSGGKLHFVLNHSYNR